LAAQGASILLNGFGDPGEIKKLQASLAAEFSVKVAYSGADMSKPDDIAGMVAQATNELGRVDILVRGISLPVDGGWTAQ
jgi:3-hydroxybutyrate dehydrogenase